MWWGRVSGGLGGCVGGCECCIEWIVSVCVDCCVRFRLGVGGLTVVLWCVVLGLSCLVLGVGEGCGVCDSRSVVCWPCPSGMGVSGVCCVVGVV